MHFLGSVEMRRDMEAAAQLEEKLRKADAEAEALRLEQKKVEEEKARIAEAAATQMQQTEAEVSNNRPNDGDKKIVTASLLYVEEKGQRSWSQGCQNGQRSRRKEKRSQPPKTAGTVLILPLSSPITFPVSIL